MSRLLDPQLHFLLLPRPTLYETVFKRFIVIHSLGLIACALSNWFVTLHQTPGRDEFSSIFGGTYYRVHKLPTSNAWSRSILLYQRSA